MISSLGRVVYLDAGTGDELLAVDTEQMFGAPNLRWGITESLLIDGNNVICTPGGEGAGVDALDKKLGYTRWICSEISERSAYCSPILIQCGGRRIIVTLTGKSLVGLDADSGMLLWRHEHKAAYDIHAVSPVYSNGLIYITSGYGEKEVKCSRYLRTNVSSAKNEPTVRWTAITAV